jgi:hypothetical protein
LFQNKL